MKITLKATASPVAAAQVTGATLTAEDGQWVVIMPAGAIVVMDDAMFQALYSVEDPAPAKKKAAKPERERARARARVFRIVNPQEGLPGSILRALAKAATSDTATPLRLMSPESVEATIRAAEPDLQFMGKSIPPALANLHHDMLVDRAPHGRSFVYAITPAGLRALNKTTTVVKGKPK